MTGLSIPPYQPGEPLKASTVNALIRSIGGTPAEGASGHGINTSVESAKNTQIIAENVPAGLLSHSVMYYRSSDQTWHEEQIAGTIPCTNSNRVPYSGKLAMTPLVPGQKYVLRGNLPNGTGAKWGGTELTPADDLEAEFIVIAQPLNNTYNRVLYKIIQNGEGGSTAPSNQKVRLVQPKELFPACEYKTHQDVYDCSLEYSDDNNEWTPLVEFDIVGGRVQQQFSNAFSGMEAHKYWRINLKGFAKPENPQDASADRGYYTYGRLWEALFKVKRSVEHESTYNGANYTFTAAVNDWQLNTDQPVVVNLTLLPSIGNSKIFYRAGSEEWIDKGSFDSSATIQIPAADVIEPKNTSFTFKIVQDTADVISVIVPKPTYKLSPNNAEVAMRPPREETAGGEPQTTADFFDSKPTPRKSGTQKYWTLTFDQPEIVTEVRFDVDQHLEHYIICPGGRDAFKQDIKFIYSFDLFAEAWTATTFPEMQKPMYNMDAKVVELVDKTHQLIILSGQVADGFSNVIQGYNFEKDYIQNAIDLGAGSLNFAGRPALMGDPMYRYGYLVNTPDGEWDFARSLIVVGGSERSCYIRGTMSAIDSVLFSIQGSTLTLGCPYETSTLNISLSNTGNTGLPFGFFDYKTTINTSAGAVGTRLQNMGTYTRHQNLPVRGILRRRPPGNTSQPSSSNPCIDFLLIGGFNPVGREEYNTRVISGIFHSPTPSAGNGGQYSLLIQNPHFYNVNNESSLLYYPDSAVALGDCCAEYVEERDEVICFGGRSSETDTAVAHMSPAVLEFDSAPSNNARWNYQKYPDMPHPRWSAASVLIRGLVRRGETIPCDRIFIIGGRNREGFVAEVDVFNLRTNQWETDWKGLDQGELEDFTPSGGNGGGPTIIIQGGGDGVQSVKAGDGVTVTGTKSNPTISVSIRSIVEEILKDTTFIGKIVESPLFVSYVTQQITDIVYDESFITQIINSETFQEFFVQQFISIISDEQYITTIINQVVNNPVLYEQISLQIVQNEEFLTHVTNEFFEIIHNDQTFMDTIITQVIEGDKLYSSISETLYDNSTFINSVAQYVVNEIDHTELLANITELIVSGAISLIAPDGSRIAKHDDNGNIVVQVATNDQYGIVKGQDNTMLETLHKVSAGADGTLSINRELLENLIEQKVGNHSGSGTGAGNWDRLVSAPDKRVIAVTENRDLLVQQTTPQQYGVVKCGKNCVCYRKPIGLQSIDAMLVADLRHGVHLFYPMVFPERLPPRVELFDKLTFIAKETSGNYR